MTYIDNIYNLDIHNEVVLITGDGKQYKGIILDINYITGGMENLDSEKAAINLLIKEFTEKEFYIWYDPETGNIEDPEGTEIYLV